MAEKPETIFKARVRRDLKKISNVWFAKIQQVTICGTPDFLCCVNGFFVALELKKSIDDNLSEIQGYNLLKISLANGYSIEANPENWPVVYKFLEVLARQRHTRMKMHQGDYDV